MFEDNAPHTALTPAQRFHFDVYGYVLLESILPSDEVAAMKEALYRMRSDPNKAARGIYLNHEQDHSIHMGNLVAYDPSLTRFAAHPLLLPLVRDVVGGEVRLEETEAIINRRDPKSDTDGLRERDIVPLGFHTGTRHGWGTYQEQDRFHCLFVKTLAYLTDVGPGDGGTAVIPGSHKMAWRQNEMIEAAFEDPKHLIRQVQGPAGSVLLFAESLIHSTTAVWSDRERVICVAGYTPPMLREWPGNEIDPAYLATLPEETRRVLSGSDSWNWRRNYPS
ncbi:MAG: phytanoyl-CoA dioxygenase family protein [Capsulimonadales bacterium]|nr:phytanoyl-CoA dioxygenase family protein [Capsulimonadales bacterium]